MALNTFTGATDNNWGTATNWSQGTVPTSTDTYTTTFDAASPNCTMGAQRDCNGIDFTAYTNTITCSTFYIIVYGSCILGASMGWSGGGGVLMKVASTNMTFNGCATLPNLIFAAVGGGTFTLLDAGDITGTLLTGGLGGSSTQTVNGFSIKCAGFTVALDIAGTTDITMDKTGTWSGAGLVYNNLTFNTAGTITVSGAVNKRTNTLTYSAGTITTTGSTLQLVGGPCTLNTSGVTWNNVSAITNVSQTYTLSSNLTCSGSFTCTANNTTFNSSNITIGASFGGAGASLGTSKFILNGTGTVSGAGVIGIDLEINTAGTITFSGTVFYRTGTFLYTAGTIITTSSVFSISGNCTLNCASITWATISTSTTTSTVTLLGNINTVDLGFGAYTTTWDGAFNMNVTGSLSLTNVAALVSGTATIILTGTGTWSGAGILKNSLTINTAGTITVSGTVNYNTGTLTYTAGTVTTTGSTLVIILSTTLVTSGMTWNNVTIGATLTLTLTSVLNISGTFIPCTGGTTNTINTSTVNISGSLSVNGTGGVVTGTSLFNINGTGTWSHASSTVLRNNLTINTAGTLTVSGAVLYNTGTLTYTAGTVVTTSSTLTASVSTTFNCASITWNNLSFSGTSQTFTLSGNLNASGTVTSGGTTAATFTGNTIYCGGWASNCTLTSGTTAIIMNGTGTLSGTSGTTVTRNTFTINTAGTVTLGAAFAYNTGVFTYTAGTVVATGNTLAISASTTLNCSGMTWNSITYQTATQTCTLSSDLNLSGTLVFANLAFTLTVNGAFSINCSGSVTHNNGCTLNGTCLKLNLNGTGTYNNNGTGYQSFPLVVNTAGTITFSGNINISGSSFTYTAGTTITTVSTLNTSGAVALNFSPNLGNWSCAGNTTLTLSVATVLTGNWTTAGTSTTVIWNGFTLAVGGNFGPAVNSGISGTTNITLNGTGTWSSATTAVVENNFTINTAGTITISGQVNYKTGTLTYTAGTIVVTGSTLCFFAGCTITTNGMSWNNILAGTTGTYTLTNNLTILGTLTTNGSVPVLTFNGNIFYIAGGINQSTNAALTGTTSFILNGTGALTSTSSQSWEIDLTINTAGTITFTNGSNMLYRTKTLTYTAGSVITTGHTLSLAASCTLNTVGISWNNVTNTVASVVLTINSSLVILGTYTCNFIASWIGTSGWTTLNFTCTTAGRTLTFKAGNTYTVNGALLLTATLASPHAFVSSTPTSAYYFVLTNNGTSTQDVDYVNSTDADSSAGLTIYSYKGVLTRTVNWGTIQTQPRTISYDNN